jgi:sulfite dehydrogenase (quinone) subunit SoeC
LKPALSVVVFTVSSGAGLGALALLAFADLLTLLHGPVAQSMLLQRASIIALGLVVIGLVASMLHLGNPRNAWRSLSRLRTSWLSREALAALALLGCASLWMLGVAANSPALARAPLAVAVIALSWLTLHCTAMIYASLKPIRQWNTPRVPLAYQALGHASGALLVVAVLRSHGESAGVFAILAGVLFLVAAGVKLDYYAYIASDTRRLTLEEAIGVPQGVGPAGASGSRMRARLFDIGHSRGTFLTQEFGYTLGPAQRTSLRLLAWLAGFVMPAVWLVSGLEELAAAVIAFAACLVGFGAERWLFFAEARHTVRLYHGERTT